MTNPVQQLPDRCMAIAMDILSEDEMYVLQHYGTPRHSGRYPWGSGDHPYQSENFYSAVQKLRSKGLSDTEIARSFDMSTGEFRARKSISKDEIRRDQMKTAMKLKDKGYSNVEIGKRLGVGESQVRNLLKPEQQQRREASLILADRLEEELKTTPYLDVGKGVERYLNVSDTKLDAALQILKERGYNVYGNIKTRQQGTGHNTTLTVLTKESWKDAVKNKSEVRMPGLYSEDGGETYSKIEEPRSVDSSRITINYADADGYQPKDGVIELRRGVADLNLGNAHYAQVRILVDGTHYLKGMAVYADDLPDGIDIRVNSNKKEGTPKEEVFKEVKPHEDNPENPFGAAIKTDRELNYIQRHYVDENGNRQLSALNIVNEEGDWDEWSRTLSSQFLGKQTPALATRQLKLAADMKEAEFAEIKTLTNPEVKSMLLQSFADECDKDATYLKAAGLPNQSSRVILPLTSIREDQVYAPDLPDGTRVVLIRHPHGSIREIPELIVNNHSPEAIRVLGKNPRDAIGINPRVAAQLSGADFDGDTVLRLVNNDHAIKHDKPFPQLKDFDTKLAYGPTEKTTDSDGKEHYFRNGVEYKIMRNTQTEMGIVSNLITDMTLRGASSDELARAIKHSMVVIDAEKHKLDYQASYVDNGIRQLKQKYQGHINPETGKYAEGASTLLSRAKGEMHIPERKQGAFVRDPETGKTRKLSVDPVTGEKLFSDTHGTHSKRVVDKDGNVTWERVPNMQTVSRMEMTKDARTLMSENGGTAMERIYAAHANRLKDLANKARLEALKVVPSKKEPSAAKAFANEVAQLEAEIDIAERRRPMERRAQLIADKIFWSRKADNPDWTKDQIKKARQRALRDARTRLGIERKPFYITDRQWEAIQAGAISSTKAKQILRIADERRVRELALPRENKGISPQKLALARSMLKGERYTWEEVAKHLGVSVSTLKRQI